MFLKFGLNVVKQRSFAFEMRRGLNSLNTFAYAPDLQIDDQKKISIQHLHYLFFQFNFLKKTIFINVIWGFGVLGGFYLYIF